MRKFLCKLGFHIWEYLEAPLVLEGYFGKIQAKICKRCGYKSPDGVFYPERKINDKVHLR